MTDIATTCPATFLELDATAQKAMCVMMELNGIGEVAVPAVELCHYGIDKPAVARQAFEALVGYGLLDGDAGRGHERRYSLNTAGQDFMAAAAAAAAERESIKA